MGDTHFYEPKDGHQLPHDPFKAIVAPRPIGWISTASRPPNTLILGQVVGVHIDPAFLKNGLFDIVAAGTIARCGYRGDYAEVTRVFETLRPFSEMSGFKSLRKR
jgi:flavin reductase (DIM6/NTAB) family NADH-FMN oxidoreductase RutF